MSDTPLADDWWQASDGRWYAPELHPARNAFAPTPTPTQTLPAIPEPSTPVLPPIPEPSTPVLPPIPGPSASVLPPIPEPPPAFHPASSAPAAPEEPRRRLVWVLAAIGAALVGIAVAVIVLVSGDNGTPVTSPAPTTPKDSSTSTGATSPGATSPESTTARTAAPTTPLTEPGAPVDPGLLPGDPATEAAALEAINGGGPTRAKAFAGAEYDSTLIQFGHAVCLTADELAATGGDSTSLIAQTLTTTRDQLAQSSSAIWADPVQAPLGYARVLYFGIKYLCPTHLPAADTAFPDLAGT